MDNTSVVGVLSFPKITEWHWNTGLVFRRISLASWVFLVALCCLIVKRLILAVVIKMFFHQLEKILWQFLVPCCSWICVPTAISCIVSFVMTDESSVRLTKTTSRIGDPWPHSLSFCYWPIFNYGHFVKGM